MDGNSQKTPLAQSLQKFGRAKAEDAVQAIGKGLPCTVVSVDGPGIVTVSFAVATKPAPLPQVQMPVAKSPYINYPIKAGDIGTAQSSDVRTGGLTGLGAGLPNIQDTVGNLSAMHFVPLGKKSDTTADPDALELNENILVSPDKLGFFGTAMITKQEVTGALSSVTDAAAKAVLTSLINKLAAIGLFDDGTT